MVVSAFAQPDTLWTKTFGGSDKEEAYSVVPTSDGGFALTGYGEGFGDPWGDAFLIKTDASGNEVWQSTYGLPGLSMDWGRSVQQTSDGGYIVAGEGMALSVAAFAGILVKFDASGNIEWDQTYSGLSDNLIKCVQQTTDGGYIMAGYSMDPVLEEADAWLVKTDASGNEVWSQTYGGANDDIFESVTQTTDGGYVMVGVSESGFDDFRIYLVKADADGNEEWIRDFGGDMGEWGNLVELTADGGFIICGYTNSYGAGSTDAWLIKTDADGNEEWNQTYGGLWAEDARSVVQTEDGGYVFTGKHTSLDFTYQAWVVKTDPDGAEEWTLDIEGTVEDAGECVREIAEGAYIVAGWTKSFGAGEEDAWLIRIGAEVSAEDIPSVNPTSFVLKTPYPNPFNNRSMVSFSLGNSGHANLSIYDITGREVASLVDGQMSSGEHQTVWNAEGMGSGVYFVRLEAGEFTQTKKLLLVK